MSFEAIMEAARNKDEAALARALGKPKNITIDILKKETFDVTPAAQLAFDGYLEAVEFLRQHGAYADPIAKGFARAGNVEQTEIYRIEYKVNVSHIAEGFSMAGNIEQAEIYRTKHKADQSKIAFGFALGGHIEQVELYRTQHSADVNWITKGFALGGHVEQAEKYCAMCGADKNIIGAIYATAGNIKMAEVYRTQHGADVDRIAFGFAAGGNIEQTDHYYTLHHGNPYLIALAFDKAGNIEQAYKYLKRSEITLNQTIYILLYMVMGTFTDLGYQEWMLQQEQSDNNRVNTQRILPVVTERTSQHSTSTPSVDKAQREDLSSASTCCPFIPRRTSKVTPLGGQTNREAAEGRKQNKCLIQ